jgi:hypothetical protein
LVSPFSFNHCIVCHSIYGFRFPPSFLLFLLTIVLSHSM